MRGEIHDYGYGPRLTAYGLAKIYQSLGVKRDMKIKIKNSVLELVKGTPHMNYSG